MEVVKDELTISVSHTDGRLLYHREFGEDVVEKELLAGKGKILICPVEPMNLPKNITSSLLVEFEKPLVVEPRYKKRVFVTFPTEIGVFTGKGKSARYIDIFGLNKPKFTLYGDVKTGSICKYWKSEVYHKLPKMDPAYEGIMDLHISNLSKRWVEVTKVVFSAYGMKIYYDSGVVSMRASMIIQGEDHSETKFIDKPLRKGMKSSKEIYVHSIQPLKGQKFIMEGGI